MTKITTPEELDEHRARAIDPKAFSQREDWCGEDRHRREMARLRAATIRAADEALGLSTDALLALINGEAVVVPSKETSE